MIGNLQIFLDADLCFDVKTVTQTWGHEITWNIGGTCDSINRFENYREDTQQCCVQDHDEFVITCKDSYGDGWHGGYLVINGLKYCEDFTTGNEYTEIYRKYELKLSIIFSDY